MPFKPFSRAALAVCLSFTLAPAALAQRSAEQFQVAIGLLQRGLHQEAARYFERFLEEQPGHNLAREAWYRLGTCQVEMGEPGDAAGSFRQALDGRGEFELEAECHYRLGHVLKEQGQLEPALEQFAALVDSADEDHYLLAASLYAAAECLRDTGADREALRGFLAAAEAATGESASFAFPSLYQAGFAQMRAGEHEDAAATFGAAADRAPDDAARGECRFLAGDAALRAGQTRDAERMFDAALEIDGEHRDDALMGLAWCRVERDDLDGAIERFQEVIRRHGSSPLAPSAQVEIARLRYRQGGYQRAVQELEGVLDSQRLTGDDRAAALELRGLALLELGEADAAEQSFTAAMGLNGDVGNQARLRFNMAEALAEKERWDEALAAYQQVRGDGVDAALRGDALYGQSLVLHRMQRYEDSRQRAEALLRDLPEHRLVVHARFAVAENLFATQSYADARSSYAQVPDDHELAGSAAFKRAWCVYLEGDKAAAAEHFGTLAESGDEAFREEALSMQALAFLDLGDHHRAMSVADTYAGRYPEGAYLARTERVAARVLRESGDLRGAAARMARAAKAADGASAGADLVEQAELMFQQGDYAEAAKIYAALRDREDRVGAQALEGLAWCAFELGDDERCRELLSAGMDHPAAGDDRAGLIELESALYHRSEDWEQAEAAALRFLREFPDHERAHEMRYAAGVAQARGGKLPEARRTLTELLEVGSFPRGSSVRVDRIQYELAWAARRDGDEQAALVSFAQVAGSEDAELAGEARLHLGTAALEGGDADGGRDHLREVDGRYRARALYRLGFSHLDNQEYERAQEAFAAIEAMGEDEPLALEAAFLVGECLVNRGDHAAAAPRFQRLLEGDPEHDRVPAARLRLGECAVILGRPDEAVQQLEAFLHGDPPEGEQARANLWLGKARIARGEHQRAQEALQRVSGLTEGPLAAEAQFRLGESRKMDGELQSAAEAFAVLPILYAHEEWVRKGLLAAGQCFEELGQPAKARSFYEELLNRYPDSAESREAKTRLRGL